MNSVKIKGISLALVFKKIDDLSVTNYMEEDYQETGGQNVALEQLGDKTMKLHSKTKDGTLKCENQ